MKPTTSIITFLLLLGASYWAFRASTPAYREDSGKPESEFSTDRAMKHVQNISEAPHAVGFPAHERVKDYLIRTLEGMGLKPEIQAGYTAGDWGNLSKAENILVRIPGTANTRALMLLSHYDSSPHSSYGASDAGSGVGAILEGLRAFLSRGQAPKNDIIVLITDAEELGLNGADLFVNSHPWARDVGLVLNFEARGSGGPSYMFVETNRGNARMIETFNEAGPAYPVANSLVYSIYKMLPNDTDLTVFREDADIEGFNFAFIDDHYDYHTALDTASRLDPESLTHQGAYLMPLLTYFSQADLSKQKSLDERVYFNVPLFKLVSYPFEWIWPMMAGAVILFLFILIYGIRKGRLQPRGMATGTLPVILSLLIGGVAGYFAWPLLKQLYPAYSDMLHGFTYNGYLYIGAFSGLCFAGCFWVYSRFSKTPIQDLMTAPLLLWLLVCGLLCAYLPGGGFFLLPVIAAILSWMILIVQERPNPYLLVLLCIPGLWIFTPFIKMLPVGLGLKMLVASSLLCVLVFFLLLPVVGSYRNKGRFALAGLVVFIALFVGGHLGSSFKAKTPKPTSLLYVKNLDRDQAFWATYEKVPSEWTMAYLGKDLQPPAPSLKTLSSKYSTGFSFTRPAPLKPVPEPEITILSDTLVQGDRLVSLRIGSGRNINRLEVFTGGTRLKEAAVNDIALSEYYLEHRRNGKLITHYVSDNDATELLLRFAEGSPLELTIYEASNDLLSNPLFSIPPRPENLLPMPFVLNDAVLQIKSIRFE
ncbi:MAG: M28 family peptidase [Robiginitalea sp.]